MEFEWDDEKAQANRRKHGISFEEAAYALGDPLIVDEPDDRFDYGEDRFVAYAMGERSILAVAYTERGETIRIVSARRATRHEQDHYYRKNASKSDA